MGNWIKKFVQLAVCLIDGLFYIRASFHFKFLVSFMMHIFKTFYLFLLFCLFFFVFCFFDLFLFIFHFSLFSSFLSASSLSRLVVIFSLSTLQLSEEINMKLLPISNISTSSSKQVMRILKLIEWIFISPSNTKFSKLITRKSVTARGENWQ